MRALRSRPSPGAARLERRRRELGEPRGRLQRTAPASDAASTVDAEVNPDAERDALGDDQRRHRAHVLVEADAKLRDRRRPARELQGREQALERIELHVEVERPGPRRDPVGASRGSRAGAC